MALKKAIVGVMLLGAIALCAFGASSASATTIHECVKAGKGTGIKYSDGTCQTELKTGEFETETLAPGSYPVRPTLTETAGGGTGGEGESAGIHAVMHGTLGGVEYRITCKKLTSPNSVAENKEVGGKMVVEGTGKSKFEECTMAKPTQCTVPATIETVELKQTTIDELNGEMFAKFAPVSGTRIVTFNIASAGGKTCPEFLKGEKTLEGSIRARVDSPDKRMLTFDSTTGSSLTFGGQPMQFTATIHFERISTGNTIAFETP